MTLPEHDSAPPVLILKTGYYPIHHGGLGIIRSLGRLGIPVYSMVEDRLIPAATSRHLTGGFVWDARDMQAPQMLDELARVGRYLDRPTILIPTDDLGAILLAENSAALRQWFVFPEISASGPRTLANKQMLYTLCREMGVPCPKTFAPTSLADLYEFAESVGYPVVVKAAAAWLDPGLKVSLARTQRELVEIWHRARHAHAPNLLLQEYIPGDEDWFFHGYCNRESDCLAGFTGTKLRSFPPHAGITTLGKSQSNDVLLRQSEMLLKAISYAGIMDIDYRLDERDGQYKLLDFNPRVGAQFRVFSDDNGLDVVKALYRDLTGQDMQRSKQVDGRMLIVEPDDLRASLKYIWRGELSIHDWIRSFRGPKEYAWFSWNDPLPFFVVVARLAIQGARKMIRAAQLKWIHRRPDVMHQEARSGQLDADT